MAPVMTMTTAMEWHAVNRLEADQKVQATYAEMLRARDIDGKLDESLTREWIKAIKARDASSPPEHVLERLKASEILREQLSGQANKMIVVDYPAAPGHIAVLDSDFLTEELALPSGMVWGYVQPHDGISEIDPIDLLTDGKLIKSECSEYAYDSYTRHYRDWKNEFEEWFKEWVVLNKCGRQLVEQAPSPLQEVRGKVDVLATLAEIQKLNDADESSSAFYFPEELISVVSSFGRLFTVEPTADQKSWKIIRYAEDESECKISTVYQRRVLPHADECELGIGLIAFVTGCAGLLRSVWRRGPIGLRFGGNLSERDIPPQLMLVANALDDLGFSVRFRQTPKEPQLVLDDCGVEGNYFTVRNGLVHEAWFVGFGEEYYRCSARSYCDVFDDDEFDILISAALAESEIVMATAKGKVCSFPPLVKD